MDNLTRQIADFAAELSYDQLPEEVIAAATRFLVDTLACAIAAHDCEPARMGLRLARGAAPDRYPGRILFHGARSTAESAAFVNTAMIRNLDFNDQYPGGHPSDCIGAFLAIAEAAKADGRRLLSSVAVAYELFVRISDATALRYKGWDQGFAIGVCTAAGVGHLFRLSPQQIGEAIAITTVANIPMRNTRAGELSLISDSASRASSFIPPCPCCWEPACLCSYPGGSFPRLTFGSALLLPVSACSGRPATGSRPATPHWQQSSTALAPTT